MKNMFTRPYYKFTILIMIICILCFFLGNMISHESSDTISNVETKVHFINVGQGDSILIQNNKFNILIDSGPNSSSDKIIKYLKKYNIKTLDYVIATHPHEDHIGSMDDVINTFKINKIIMPKITSPDSDFSNMIKILKSKNLTITTPSDNSTIKLDENNYISFLWTGNLVDDNLNNYSLVIKYVNKNTSFLFTGDSEEIIEKKLLISNASLNSDILKVSHHGSKSSSSSEFLAKVTPLISIISCGVGNDYGHPHKETLTTLMNVNSHIFRTDINGNIVVKTDGESLMVLTQYKNEN
ncbi:MAG: MBL fold metallo-hydrolase [Clostridium sp.]|uniref:ComEC/Rec2 family competence protein n=1 Tax=Clostridium sp. TaxID=1506 RepID=UPI002FC905F4